MYRTQWNSMYFGLKTSARVITQMGSIDEVQRVREMIWIDIKVQMCNQGLNLDDDEIFLKTKEFVKYPSFFRELSSSFMSCKYPDVWDWTGWPFSRPGPAWSTVRSVENPCQYNKAGSFQSHIGLTSMPKSKISANNFEQTLCCFVVQEALLGSFMSRRFYWTGLARHRLFSVRFGSWTESRIGPTRTILTQLPNALCFCRRIKKICYVVDSSHIG